MWILRAIQKYKLCVSFKSQYFFNCSCTPRDKEGHSIHCYRNISSLGRLHRHPVRITVFVCGGQGRWKCCDLPWNLCSPAESSSNRAFSGDSVNSWTLRERRQWTFGQSCPRNPSSGKHGLGVLRKKKPCNAVVINAGKHWQTHDV